MKKKATSKRSLTETDWKRVRTMRDSDINLSDIPELTPEMFARAIVRRGLRPKARPKVQLTVRVDRDVLAWHRSRGRGYQTQIGALLKSYMEASRGQANAKRR